MGGVLILASLIPVMLFINKGFGRDCIAAMVMFLGSGLIGLLDDGIKVVRKRSLGLRAYQKLIGQFLFAVLLAVYGFINVGSRLYIPFTESTLDLGYLYIPAVTLAVIYITNCVNLTDGLDGLASSITMTVCLFFTFICMSLHMDDLAVFSAGISGACLGFLRYNAHPAQVIMGDTGALALGGAVSALSVLTGTILYLPLVGFIYVVEGLSVMLQVIFFKLTRRRIFKMAPIHHHFELSGWSETQIVQRFWLISLMSAMIGVALAVI
jgi:phospho-N-acetylmuramoyl-pentapeptide-transferase